MAVNGQYLPGQGPFGIIVPQGTGAGGSPGSTLADARPDSQQVPVVGLYQTSQGTLPVVGVGSDDVNTPQQTSTYGGGDPLTGGDGYGATGAGAGRVAGPPHPNAMGPGPLAAQAEAAGRPR